MARKRNYIRSSEIRRLEQIRDIYERRATQYEKIASQYELYPFAKTSETAELYAKRAENFRNLKSQLTIKNITTAKRGTQQYKEDVARALAKAERVVSMTPSVRNIKDVVRSESLAREQYKYAGREIAIATYNKIWFSEMTAEQRSRALAQEVTRATGIENPTAKQIMDYYEEEIRKQMVKKYGNVGYMYELPRSAGQRDIEMFGELQGEMPIYYINGSPVVFDVSESYSKYLG